MFRFSPNLIEMFENEQLSSVESLAFDASNFDSTCEYEACPFRLKTNNIVRVVRNKILIVIVCNIYVSVTYYIYFTYIRSYL